MGTVHPENSMETANYRTFTSNMTKLARRPSNKLITNGLVLLGGAICLSRGHSSLGAKVAIAYMLGKLTKRRVSSKNAGKLSCNKGS
ncbi:hypothetical protein CDL12_03411 [Handroanthus impetiginosus]|uniref:Uncharacterized protein n=1 Tax=Handroanthus impetiginosus TaxID=429701 RepID=A0A2G9I287_9LAMI|nr:hypothetical protein CDL12_03411 [Handroanthus impetiginosus]